MSADLSIPGPNLMEPNIKPPSGESSNFEVFKCCWHSRGRKDNSRPNSRNSQGTSRNIEYEPKIVIERLVSYINRD